MYSCSESVPFLRVLLRWKCSYTLRAYALKVLLQIACIYSESVPAPHVFLLWDCSSVECVNARTVHQHNVYSCSVVPATFVFKIEECSRPMCSCSEGPSVVLYVCSSSEDPKCVPSLRGSCYICVLALRVLLSYVCSFSESDPAEGVFLFWGRSCSISMCVPALRALLLYLYMCSCSESDPAEGVFLFWGRSCSISMCVPALIGLHWYWYAAALCMLLRRVCPINTWSKLHSVRD